jgi:hypothetical protein
MSGESPRREAVLRLLQDVAESEHQLRHRIAFADACAALQFEVVHDPHRTTVRDPLAPAAAEPAAGPAEAESGQPAANEA